MARPAGEAPMPMYCHVISCSCSELDTVTYVWGLSNLVTLRALVVWIVPGVATHTHTHIHTYVYTYVNNTLIRRVRPASSWPHDSLS